jgi:hypothetical protein
LLSSPPLATIFSILQTKSSISSFIQW